LRWQKTYTNQVNQLDKQLPEIITIPVSVTILKNGCFFECSIRVTDQYIEKDFAYNNDANFKLLDDVFNKKDATK